VQRYERLRGAAVDGQPAGGLGLALLVDRGIAAWTLAWPRGAPASPARPAPGLAAGDGPAIVGVLADMALACLRGG
jgi:hypothetical protein